MGSRRQAADARGVARVRGIQAEFQNAVFAAHLLVVPVIIAVVEFGEVGMTLDKPRLRPGDHPVSLGCENLLLHPRLLAKSRIERKSHSGARNPKTVVRVLMDRIELLIER